MRDNGSRSAWSARVCCAAADITAATEPPRESLHRQIFTAAAGTCGKYPARSADPGPASEGYAAARSQPLVLPLAFIAAPLVLHRPTRDSLPRTTATRLATWISRNAMLQAGFPGRAASLVPTVMEGLRYQALTLGRDGSIVSAMSARLEGDAGVIVDRARFVGRWLAGSGDAATIFGLFGVEP